MSIKYKITRFELNGDPPDEYIVGFYMKNEENQKHSYVESMIPFVSGENKTDGEICNIAFSASYDYITGVSGRLESVATVVGAEFLPPGM